jgi:glycine/D-amino acid oxidase-like deaminating enzyme
MRLSAAHEQSVPRALHTTLHPHPDLPGTTDPRALRHRSRARRPTAHTSPGGVGSPASRSAPRRTARPGGSDRAASDTIAVLRRSLSEPAHVAGYPAFVTHPSLWVREATPLPQEPDPLPTRCDAVVIGGGVAGTSAALALARRGIETVLLEAGTVASRASGRNDGQVLLGLGEHYNRIVGQFGAEDARRLWDFIHRNHDDLRAELEESGIECGFAQRGGLRLAETEHEQDELADAARLLAGEGIEHELLDADALARVFPGARGFFGALALPGEAVVQPAAMVRGIALAARAAGARVYEQARVVEVGAHDENDGTRITLADGREVQTTIVVHATSTLGNELDPSGFLQKHVFPFRGQILASEPLARDVAARFPADRAMSSNFCYEYFRLHRDQHGGAQRFVVGGMRWRVKGEEVGILDDDSVNPEVSEHLLDWVRAHFPDLEGVAFPDSWTGIMAGTGDGLPLVGALPIGDVGRFALCAFNGYGMSFAFRAGALVAELIAEGRSEDPAAPMFSPRRFA